ncbi:recombination mediator RecR [Parachlamydia sp. AcF125]|uniref:recombination mediator RecR n=1 Tax=Parachlamydia sp. AcF125 TaxID=2795736 RepID=UPI001BCA3C1B|nr:recombination mediator RecR [Parachlamydia sp. AcF125]MBS4169190.1 Recombination protein RecR [Parachlamydia sp. AcF125]
MRYPSHLIKLIQVLKKLPGVGTRSAERFAFQLMEWEEEKLKEFGTLLSQVPEKIQACGLCGCLKDEGGECPFCNDPIRQTSKTLCLICSSRDAFSIEETREYKGLYHVLGGLLSPIAGFGPECLSLTTLKERIKTYQIDEVVIALGSTLEGDATALYIKRELSAFPIQVSRLAYGLPVGSSLDYVDGGTLARAFSGRASF